jgi:hypothetical protein
MLAIRLGLTSSLGSSFALLLIAPVLLAAALWAATRYSQKFMIGSVLTLTLIPSVGFPSDEFLHPGILGLIVIAFTGFAGLLPRRRAQLTMLDVAALVILAGCALSVAYGHQTKKDLDHVFFFWFCPYFAARSITGSVCRTTVLKAFAVAGAVAIPFGIVEITYGNLFLKVFPFGSDPQHGLGVPTQRLGIIRAEGALGQPIPYAIFLSIAAVAAMTLWITRENRRSHRWLYVGLGIVVIDATTLARTGWLMLAVVAGLVIALNFKTVFNYGNTRLIVLVMIGLIVIFAVPKTNALILGSSGTESARLETSANYRSQLIQQALKPGYIDPYGTTEPQIGPFGAKSIDDEYIHAAWTWGYLPLVGFALMFLGFVQGAWRQRRDIVALAVYATCIATIVALENVAFLTQQEVLIWLLWGCASGLAVRPSQKKLKRVPYALLLEARPGDRTGPRNDRRLVALGR